MKDQCCLQQCRSELPGVPAGRGVSGNCQGGRAGGEAIPLCLGITLGTWASPHLLHCLLEHLQPSPALNQRLSMRIVHFGVPCRKFFHAIPTEVLSLWSSSMAEWWEGRSDLPLEPLVISPIHVFCPRPWGCLNPALLLVLETKRVTGRIWGHWLGVSQATHTLLMKSSLNQPGEFFTCLLEGESTLVCCHSLCNEGVLHSVNVRQTLWIRQGGWWSQGGITEFSGGESEGRLGRCYKHAVKDGSGGVEQWITRGAESLTGFLLRASTGMSTSSLLSLATTFMFTDLHWVLLLKTAAGFMKLKSVIFLFQNFKRFSDVLSWSSCF